MQTKRAALLNPVYNEQPAEEKKELNKQWLFYVNFGSSL